MTSKTVIIALLGLVLGICGLLVYKVIDIDKTMGKMEQLKMVSDKPVETDVWKSQKLGELEKENAVLKERVDSLEKTLQSQGQEVRGLAAKVKQQDDSVIKILKKAMDEEKVQVQPTAVPVKPAPKPTAIPAITPTEVAAEPTAVPESGK